MPNERMLHVNGISLCAETRGDPADPAILLMHGATSSMDWWEDEFCDRLAEGGRYVIRYDQRDTGRSETFEPGNPPYSAADLLADAAALLDELGVRRAHVAGLSMGGAIAQYLAVKHPGRVATLTLIATSPAGPGADPDLPSMPAGIVAEFQQVGRPDWSDRASTVDYLALTARLCAARSAPFATAETRELAGRVFDRSPGIASSENHFVMPPNADGDTGREQLSRIGAPTLVIHGDEDPVFPLPHGVALAKEIPGATLLTLEQTGHELPRRTWDTVVPALLEHTQPEGPTC